MWGIIFVLFSIVEDKNTDHAGANVKFRIDKNASNEVVLDLNKEKDIKSEKEFKKKFENKLDSWFDDWRGKKSS